MVVADDFPMEMAILPSAPNLHSKGKVGDLWTERGLEKKHMEGRQGREEGQREVLADRGPKPSSTLIGSVNLCPPCCSPTMDPCPKPQARCSSPSTLKGILQPAPRHGGTTALLFPWPMFFQGTHALSMTGWHLQLLYIYTQIYT